MCEKSCQPEDNFSGFAEIRDMDSVNNNKFEVKSITNKRKIRNSNVYLNPALDILANEDPICNTAMEIPVKKRKRTKSSDIVTFENSALDLGAKPVNEVLVREIDNVRRTVKVDLNEAETKVAKETVFGNIDDVDFTDTIDSSNMNKIEENAAEDLTEPIYANVNIEQDSKNVEAIPSIKYVTDAIHNVTDVTEHTITKDSLLNCTDISRIDQDHTDIDSGILVEEKVVEKSPKDISNTTNIHTNITNQVILNNSNINLSFIDRLALDSPNLSDRSLYYDDDLNESNIMEIKTITIITKKKRFVEKKNTNPFLNSNIETNIEVPKINPFLDLKTEIDYQGVSNRQEETATGYNNDLMPRRLFDTSSTISTVNESIDQPEYENINIHPDPIYENIDELNKQSKLLGYDVSQFNSTDIMNFKAKANNSNDSNDSKKDKHSFFKPGKLSKKVFKTLRRTFKHDKTENDVTLNPYEVPRKLPKQKTVAKDTGIENPALNLDNSDDLEIDELSDEEHQYETIKTLRNTQLNMNVTPLRERNEDTDVSRTTPSKKVRFDSTLNQEKVITGNSFDCSVASPGFDAKIDKYHDELENCINERKFLQQNM